MRLATIFRAGFCVTAVCGGGVGVAQTTGAAPNCCGVLPPVHDYSQKSMVGTAHRLHDTIVVENDNLEGEPSTGKGP